MDLAGDLCSPPSGALECEWLAKATVSTSFGTLTDEIGFRTATAPAPAINEAPSISSIRIAGEHGVGKDRLDLAFTLSDPDGDSINWAAALSVPDRPGWSLGRVAPTDHCGNGSGRANGANSRVTGVARNGHASVCVYYSSPGGVGGSYNILTVTANDGRDEAAPQMIRVLAF